MPLIPPIDVEGVEQETVDVAVRLGRAGFERLLGDGVPCKSIWLTGQPDGSFALGVVTAEPPEALGLVARAVEMDDRAQRFGESGGHPATRQLRAQLSKLVLHRDLCRDAGLDTAVAEEAIAYVEREIARGEGRLVAAGDEPVSLREAVEALVDVMPYLHPNPNALHAEKWAGWREAAIEKAARALAADDETAAAGEGAPSIDTLEGLRYLLAVRAAQTRLVIELIRARGDEGDAETLKVFDLLSRGTEALADIVERKDWANEDGV